MQPPARLEKAASDSRQGKKPFLEKFRSSLLAAQGSFTAEHLFRDRLFWLRLLFSLSG